MFLSPRKRLMGDANTSSYVVFHSKVNNSVPGRHSFIFKTGSETLLRRNAGFRPKVKLQCLRFFLHTVTRPNESKHACCQTNFQKSFFRLVHRTCALAYIKYLKNEKQMCQYFQKHPVYTAAGTVYIPLLFPLSIYRCWHHCCCFCCVARPLGCRRSVPDAPRCGQDSAAPPLNLQAEPC